MQTVTIELFKFNELSAEAQKVAIQQYREEGIDTSFICDEAHQTVKAFERYFPTNSKGYNSWLDCRIDDMDYLDEINDFSYLRLRTYLINNFSSVIYQGKYYSKWKDDKCISRRSKIQFESDCPLTGVCYDYDMLNPILKFIEGTKYTNYSFEDLLKQCYTNLRRSLESEEEAMHEDAYIKETIIANEYDFTIDGERY